MSTQDLLTYIGFVLSMATGIAGWFWEFTTKDDDTGRKRLTYAGRYAFVGAIAIFVVAFVALLSQDAKKRQDANEAAKEKEGLQQKFNRLATNFEISHIEVAFALDNENELVRAFRKGRDDALIQITSADPLPSQSNPDSALLRALVGEAAKFSFWLAKKDFNGSDPLPDNYDFMMSVGSASVYDSSDINIKWGIRSSPGPKQPFVQDGYTVIHLTIPESAIQIPGGIQSARSFYDLAGRTIFLQPWVGPMKLWYFRIHAKNRIQYPVFDSVLGTARSSLSIDQGEYAKLTIPRSAPWVPE